MTTWTPTPGDRVRLHAASPILTLRSDTGTVIRADDYDGYWVIRLDEPATYRAHGADRVLTEVREYEENLTLLDPTP